MQKKIAIFLDYYYVGGIEKVISDIKKYLENEYEFDIISFSSNNKNVISILNKTYRNFFIRNILGLIKINKHFKNKKYDVIHINCYNSFGLIYGKILKKYTKKIIIHAHSSNIDKDMLHIKKSINLLIKMFFKDKDFIYVAVSKGSSLFCFGNKESILIANGINYNNYVFNKNLKDEYRKKYNIDNKKIVIGNIGRLEKQKNQLFILDIFNDLLKINKNYILILE